jgi:hypothetical protein
VYMWQTREQIKMFCVQTEILKCQCLMHKIRITVQHSKCCSCRLLSATNAYFLVKEIYVLRYSSETSMCKAVGLIPSTAKGGKKYVANLPLETQK